MNMIMETIFEDEWNEQWYFKMKSVVPRPPCFWYEHNGNVTKNLMLKYPDSLSRNRDTEIFKHNTFDEHNTRTMKYRDMFAICACIKITINDFKKHPDEKWDFRALSRNSCLTIKMIKFYPDEKWNWYDILENGAITMDMITNNYDIFKPHMDWQMVCRNPNMNIDMIIANKNKDLDWERLTKHKNITLDIIQKNNKLPWSALHICENPNVTMDMLFKYSYIDRKRVIYNPNLTIAMVSVFPMKTNDWNHIAKNPNLLVDDILKRVPKDMRNSYDLWMSLCENPSITMKHVLDNIDYIGTVGWMCLSRNEHLNLDEVLSNQHLNWDWQNVGSNHFSNDKSRYVNYHVRRILLMAMHEFHKDVAMWICDDIEHILLDCRLVAMIGKY